MHLLFPSWVWCFCRVTLGQVDPTTGDSCSGLMPTNSGLLQKASASADWLLRQVMKPPWAVFFRLPVSWWSCPRQREEFMLWCSTTAVSCGCQSTESATQYGFILSEACAYRPAFRGLSENLALFHRLMQDVQTYVEQLSWLRIC